FFSSRRRHTRLQGDWSSDVCSSDLQEPRRGGQRGRRRTPWRAPCPPSSSGAAPSRTPCGRNAKPTRRPLVLPSIRSTPVGSRRRSEERRVGKEWRGGWGVEPWCDER